MLVEAQVLVPVSVVVPCYCCTETVERAIHSVASQTIRPNEVILIEDGSSDNTLSVLYGLQKKYGNWIRVVPLPKNLGVASARNTGWTLAKNPYIAFLDADDAWHPKKIEIQLEFMVNNLDVMLCGHQHRELSENNDDSLQWTLELKQISKVTWLQMLLKNQFITPSIMLKKEINFRFSETARYMEDHFLWLEIVSAGMLTVKLDIDLAAVYKPMYGASGLSANMWMMEKAELSNYRQLYNQGKLVFGMYMFLQCFSLTKYIKRILVVYILRHFGVK